MTKQEYIINLVNKFNADSQNSELSEVEMAALNHIRDIESEVFELDKKGHKLQEEINNTQAQIIRLRSKSEGIQDLLFSLAKFKE